MIAELSRLLPAESVRKAFPVLKDVVYLNVGSMDYAGKCTGRISIHPGRI